VDNAYNRIDKPNTVLLAANTAYGTASWRQTGGASNMKVVILNGLTGREIDLLAGMIVTAGGSAVRHFTGVGYDSTSEPIDGQPRGEAWAPASSGDACYARVLHCPGIGLHTYYHLEFSNLGTSATVLSANRTYLSSRWGC
jgi:hypothetical protein